MNDESGPVGVTTNGIRKGHDAEPSKSTHEGTETIAAQSVDERLEALMETIRTWDWRADFVEAGPPRVDEKVRTASVLAAAAEMPEDFEPTIYGPLPVQGAAEAQSGLLEPMPRTVMAPSEPAEPTADTRTVATESTPVPVTDPALPVEPTADTRTVATESTPVPVTDPAAPAEATAETQTVVLDPTPDPVTVGPSAVPMGLGDASDDNSLPSEPRPRAETRRGPIGRLWAHRGIRVAALCLAAAIAVILVIWGIRATHKDPGSSGPNLPPPSTTTTRAASSQSAQTSFVAPIDSTQLTQYEQYAAGFQTANGAATKGLDGAGSAPTTAQLAPVVGAYRAAVNLYDFQLHFIQWPASMQTAIQADHAQLTALLGLLQSFSTISATGTSAWLSDLHNQANTAQTADDVIRKDVGLPSSSSFP